MCLCGVLNGKSEPFLRTDHPDCTFCNFILMYFYHWSLNIRDKSLYYHVSNYNVFLRRSMTDGRPNYSNLLVPETPLIKLGKCAGHGIARNCQEDNFWPQSCFRGSVSLNWICKRKEEVRHSERKNVSNTPWKHVRAAAVQRNTRNTSTSSASPVSLIFYFILIVQLYTSAAPFISGAAVVAAAFVSVKIKITVWHLGQLFVCLFVCVWLSRPRRCLFLFLPAQHNH